MVTRRCVAKFSACPAPMATQQRVAMPPNSNKQAAACMSYFSALTASASGAVGELPASSPGTGAT